MRKIKNISVGILSLIILTSSCKNDKKTGQTTVFSTNNLLSQKFSINADTDTILLGKSVTKIRIYKNTFVDDKGKIIVKGTIDIELKEALKSWDGQILTV